MRIHDVSPEFIEELAAVGYENLPIDDLIAMRIHGIGPEQIEELTGILGE